MCSDGGRKGESCIIVLVGDIIPPVISEQRLHYTLDVGDIIPPIISEQRLHYALDVGDIIPPIISEQRLH